MSKRKANRPAWGGGAIQGDGLGAQISTHVCNSTSKRERTQIEVGGRIVGEVRGNVFHKTVCGSKHFLRKPRAIAFDVASLDDAERAGAESVAVTDRETGQVYRASIGRIRARGIRLNRGYGAQVALTIGEFNISDDAPTPTTPKPTQPLLFALPRVG